MIVIYDIGYADKWSVNETVHLMCLLKLNTNRQVLLLQIILPLLCQVGKTNQHRVIISMSPKEKFLWNPLSIIFQYLVMNKMKQIHTYWFLLNFTSVFLDFLLFWLLASVEQFSLIPLSFSYHFFICTGVLHA